LRSSSAGRGGFVHFSSRLRLCPNPSDISVKRGNEYRAWAVRLVRPSLIRCKADKWIDRKLDFRRFDDPPSGGNPTCQSRGGWQGGRTCPVTPPCQLSHPCFTGKRLSFVLLYNDSFAFAIVQCSFAIVLR
jgi:hypothetical protein